MPVWKPIDTVPRGKTVLVRKRIAGLANLLAGQRPEKDGWYYNTAITEAVADEAVRRWADEWAEIPTDDQEGRAMGTNSTGCTEWERDFDSEEKAMPQNISSDDVLLPPWAECLAHGDYRIVGAMLPTRDGRKVGNATILKWETRAFDAEPEDGARSSSPYLVAVLLTDAGNEVRMTERELMEQFWPPTWVRKVGHADQARQRRGFYGATGQDSMNHHVVTPFEAGTERLVENGDDQGQAILSIAASLKRIADVVDPVDKSRGDFFQQADSWFHHWLGTWIRSR